MEKEEEFALRWLKTKEIPMATRYTYIVKVFIDKPVQHGEKGNKFFEEESTLPLSIEEANK